MVFRSEGIVPSKFGLFSQSARACVVKCSDWPASIWGCLLIVCFLGKISSQIEERDLDLCTVRPWVSSEALFSLLIIPRVWCQPLAVLLGAAADGRETTRDGEIGKLRLYMCVGGFRGAKSEGYCTDRYQDTACRSTGDFISSVLIKPLVYLILRVTGALGNLFFYL